MCRRAPIFQWRRPSPSNRNMKGQPNFTRARLASVVRRAVDKVVAQVSNLLYRSASSLRMPRRTRRDGHGNVLPIGNRRYSRFETCATPNWSDFVSDPALVRLLAILAIAFVALSAPAASLTNGMVATVHPLATEAGLNVLKQGGNAIDATVAVALTLGIVDGENSGIGGGCFMLIRRASGETVAIDGRETAPAAASRDMFVRNGRAKTELSQTGALASGVPGSLAAYEF